MKKASFIIVLSLVILFYLPCLAEDFEYGRIVGDRKYFVENPALWSETFLRHRVSGRGAGSKTKDGGRDYIVRNPRATLPPPSGIPLAKMDSSQQECEVWTEDQRVSFSELIPYDPRIAVSGDTIHVVWEQWWEVFYKRSVDAGMTWGDSVILSLMDTNESFQQDIAVVGNNVYVVWFRCTDQSDGGIYLRRSTNGGETWHEISPVALRGVDDIPVFRPAIAAKDSEVYVAYGKNENQNFSLRFKKSRDYGQNWDNEILISERGAEGISPKIALNSTGLFVVRGRYLTIWCNRSTNWGDSWSDDVFISDMDSSIAQWPSIGVDNNGGIYITWFDYKYSPYPWTGDIFLRRSADNGESWDSIVTLTDNHLCIESDVCADQNSVHVVWHDERHEGNVEIYHRRSTNLGVIWSDDIRVTDAPYESLNPRLTKDNSYLHMVWIDNRNDPEPQAVYFKKGVWYYPGDANGDKILDIGDVVYLINFLFIGGSEPDVFEAGDANGDDVIDVGDIIHLINYLFIGGPPPAGC